MTRAELVEFLEKQYKPNEELFWQTISYEDVAPNVEDATLEIWLDFIDYQDRYAILADKITEDVSDDFREFVETTIEQAERDEQEED